MPRNILIDFLIVAAVAVFLWQNEKRGGFAVFKPKATRVLTPLSGSPDLMSDPFATQQSPFLSYAPPWAFGPPVDNFSDFDSGY